MSCPNLPPGWEEGCGYNDGPDDCPWKRPIESFRRLYRYTATGHIQPNFPRVGDELLYSNPIITEASFYSTLGDAFEDERALTLWWGRYSLYSMDEFNEMRYWHALSDRPKAGEWTSMRERNPEWETSTGEWISMRERNSEWETSTGEVFWSFSSLSFDLLEEPRIAHYQEHESVDYASLGLIRVEPMSPDP